MTMANNNFAWAVVGAGPAGIAAVGKLLDNGILPETILWIDPAFTVGGFGTKWLNVPSNTKVALFHKFFNASAAFNIQDCPKHLAFFELPMEETCQLSLVTEPLQWITAELQKRVKWHTGKVQEMKLRKQHWQITLDNITISAKNVLLAIGAEPKSLDYPKVETIALDVALNPEQIGHYCTVEDTVAVFGSSHSALLILRNLLDYTQVKKIINYYRTPLCYAVDLGGEILFDDTGLKGTTAQWARENIHGVLPQRLSRVLVSEKNPPTLEECNKAIYAIGFVRRSLTVEGLGELAYIDKRGIIAPGLFGLGIAFPEAKQNRFGMIEYRVGLWKFMEYLNYILPIWLRYSI